MTFDSARTLEGKRGHRRALAAQKRTMVEVDRPLSVVEDIELVACGHTGEP